MTRKRSYGSMKIVSLTLFVLSFSEMTKTYGTPLNCKSINYEILCWNFQKYSHEKHFYVLYRLIWYRLLNNYDILSCRFLFHCGSLYGRNISDHGRFNVPGDPNVDLQFAMCCKLVSYTFLDRCRCSVYFLVSCIS